jgi:predicted metal-binding membrane protein
MSYMPKTSSAMLAVKAAAMMVAMMLPSIAPSLWRYHRHLDAMRTPHIGQRTTLFAAGYLGVWTLIGFMLFAMSSALPQPVAPWMAGAVVLSVGALQRSRWKAKQLLRCRAACVTMGTVATVLTAWRDGCRLGVDCGLSCGAPMAVLLVSGLMDARMMAVITVAITAERVAPSGARVARLSGAFALLAGMVMCVRALGA